MADRPCGIADCPWQGTETVTLSDGAVLVLCVEHHQRVNTSTSRLGWWERDFASRLTADSDLPRPGDHLHTRRFRLIEVTPNG